MDTHLIVIVQGLERGVRLANASGMTRMGAPYLRVHLANGVLRSGESIVQKLEFKGIAKLVRVTRLDCCRDKVSHDPTSSG